MDYRAHAPEAYIQLHTTWDMHIPLRLGRMQAIWSEVYMAFLWEIAFFGESMFSHVSNASKAGFITLVQELRQYGFELIDCQVYTDHLAQFGAIEVARDYFLTKIV